MGTSTAIRLFLYQQRYLLQQIYYNTIFTLNQQLFYSRNGSNPHVYSCTGLRKWANSLISLDPLFSYYLIAVYTTSKTGVGICTGTIKIAQNGLIFIFYRGKRAIFCICPGLKLNDFVFYPGLSRMFMPKVFPFWYVFRVPYRLLV